MKITGAICVILLILFGCIANAGDICLLQEMQLKEAPLVRQEDSIWYGTLINNIDFGSDTGGTFEAAIRFTPTELGPYIGWSIVAISFYHSDSSTISGFVKVSHDDTVTTEPYYADSIGWKRVDLTNPVQIPDTPEVWCSVEITHGPNELPIGLDPGPAVPFKGDWLYWNGSWQEMRNLGFNYNWQILCFVDSFDVGINEIVTPSRESTNGLNVSPNPFTTVTNIFLPSTGHGARGKELSIYDITGRRVRDFILYPSSFILSKTVVWGGKDNNGKKLANGIYFVTYKDKRVRITKKLFCLSRIQGRRCKNN